MSSEPTEPIDKVKATEGQNVGNKPERKKYFAEYYKLKRDEFLKK